MGNFDIVSVEGPEKKVVWDGVLEWSASHPNASLNQEIIKTICGQFCTDINVDGSQAVVIDDTWPPSLYVKYISKNLLNPLRPHILNSEFLWFQPYLSDELYTLNRMLRTGNACLVHLIDFEEKREYRQKVLVLIDTEDTGYKGIIPNDQTQFIMDLNIELKKEAEFRREMAMLVSQRNSNASVSI